MNRPEGPPPSPSPAEGSAGRTDPNSGENGSFTDFLRGIPVLYGVVGAAIAAVLNLFVVRSLLPEPLDGLDVMSTLLILVALLVGWVGRKRIRRHLGLVIAGTTLSLVLLFFGNAFLVCAVPYGSGTENIEQSFLTGWSVVDPDLQGLSCSEAIRMVGNSRDDLRAIWGGSFDLALFGYTFLYLATVFGVVVSLAAVQPASVGGKRESREVTTAN